MKSCSPTSTGAARRAVATLWRGRRTQIGVRTDVRKRSRGPGTCRGDVKAFGAVHVVCNNAGVSSAAASGCSPTPIGNGCWASTCGGPSTASPCSVRLLEAQGEGHIVSTASTSGLGAPVFNAPYSAAKAGVIALMETVRRELDDRGSPMGASVLCPGPVAAPLIERSAAHASAAVTVRIGDHGGPAVRPGVHGTLLDVGVAPDAVAGMVVEAILENRFWILTHPAWGDVMRRRVEAMVTTGALTFRGPRTDARCSRPASSIRALPMTAVTMIAPPTSVLAAGARRARAGPTGHEQHLGLGEHGIATAGTCREATLNRIVPTTMNTPPWRAARRCPRRGHQRPPARRP